MVSSASHTINRLISLLLPPFLSPCSGSFDFFYLPIDFRNKCNLGYCFLNFLDAASAARLYRQYHAKRWEEYNSKKVRGVLRMSWNFEHRTALAWLG